MRRRFNLAPFTRKPARIDRELQAKLKCEWRLAGTGSGGWREHHDNQPQKGMHLSTRYTVVPANPGFYELGICFRAERPPTLDDLEMSAIVLDGFAARKSDWKQRATKSQRRSISRKSDFVPGSVADSAVWRASTARREHS